MTFQPAELGDAISNWLEYKRICGFEKLLSEALLVTPISEYLVGKGWDVSAERDYRTIFNRANGAGYFNYDVDAERSEDRLLIEVKYLKVAKGRDVGPAIATERIFEDIAKLAFPSSECRRLLIVASAANVNSYPALDELIRLKEVVVDFPVTGGGICGGRLFKFRDGISNAIKAIDEGGLPNSCTVHLASGGGSSRRAFIFEVRR